MARVPLSADSPAARLHTPQAYVKREYSRQRRLQRRRIRVIFVIRGLAHGMREQELGEMLDLKQSTFTNMIYREMAYCGVTNKVQLVFYYIKTGVLTGEDINKRPTHGEGRQL